jgi:hypothetical protein
MQQQLSAGQVRLDLLHWECCVQQQLSGGHVRLGKVYYTESDV